MDIQDHELDPIEAPEAAKPKRRGKPDQVKVRVGKKGVGQISTGKHVEGVGDETYPLGEIISMELEAARILEDRGWVEIQ